MAIAAMVCGIVGVTTTLACGPTFVIGLVGLILGIVALVRIRGNPTVFGGRGMAVAGIATGGVSVLIFLLLLLSIAPMVIESVKGKARDDARRLQSSTQLTEIGVALVQYANDNQGWMPEAGSDFVARLAPAYLETAKFESPYTDPGDTTGYVYVPPSMPLDRFRGSKNLVLMYESPELYAIARRGGHVLFADGRVEYMSQPGYQRWVEAIDAANKPLNR